MDQGGQHKDAGTVSRNYTPVPLVDVVYDSALLSPYMLCSAIQTILLRLPDLASKNIYAPNPSFSLSLHVQPMLVGVRSR